MTDTIADILNAWVYLRPYVPAEAQTAGDAEALRLWHEATARYGRQDASGRPETAQTSDNLLPLPAAPVGPENGENGKYGYEQFAAVFKARGYNSIQAALTKWRLYSSPDDPRWYDESTLEHRKDRMTALLAYGGGGATSSNVSDCPKCGKAGAALTGKKGPFWKCEADGTMWDAENRARKAG